ncbi:anthranilate synthase component 2 [Hasllibacter halocynthiae]|uniref:Anthranilate synthase component 2 n=1 Tax=Hasllibacter halocynthiae TaxID=595589 RepID=A0A2T0X7Y6_9RHOB|nr:aminodeoxychorismate/anthranilate synthase component II [Hasllibacter halocynthiae]PRY95062.1 anthranilate synthase component 2 [Hasllibacter halocynthiae]
MLLLIDNYDSFTWNLVHLIGDLGVEAKVVRNDALTVREAMAMRPSAIVLSPGPCDPDAAGICVTLVLAAAEAGMPLFGVCLGMQAIGQAFGGRIVRAPAIVHGKPGRIRHDGAGVFAGLPSPLSATRYHSLAVDPARLPDELEVTARVADGTVMGLRHRAAPVEGVQFHPESIRSQHGRAMLRTFLDRVPLPA